MPRAVSYLLVFFLLTAAVSARPKPQDSLIEAAVQFLFSDTLCDFFCETVESDEDDDDSFNPCDYICDDSDEDDSSSSTIKPTFTTTTTPRNDTLCSSTTIQQEVESTTPRAAVSNSSLPASQATTTTTTDKTVPSAPKDGSTANVTVTPTPNPNGNKGGEEDKAKGEAFAASSNEVYVVPAEVSSSDSASAQLSSQEMKAVNWPEFKARLMPFLPELIQLWCDWRDIFTNPTSKSALERLCPPVSNQTIKPSVLFLSRNL